QSNQTRPNNERSDEARRSQDRNTEEYRATIRSKAQMKYAILIEPQEEGGYTVTVPDLPGCISQGETREECRRNIAEAIEGWIETARAHGWPIPKPKSQFEEVEIKASA